MSNWRDLPVETRYEYEEWCRNQTTERQVLGRETYGDTFQGDPLEHAAEKAFDLPFYIWQAKRQREALTELLRSVTADIHRGHPAMPLETCYLWPCAGAQELLA